MIGCDAAKRTGKEPEKFGKGSPEAMVAPETTDIGSAGGASVPLPICR